MKNGMISSRSRHTGSPHGRAARIGRYSQIVCRSGIDRSVILLSISLGKSYAYYKQT